MLGETHNPNQASFCCSIEDSTKLLLKLENKDTDGGDSQMSPQKGHF